MAGLLDILQGLGGQTQQAQAQPQDAPSGGILGGIGGGQFGDRFSDLMAGLAMGSNSNDSIAKAGMMIAQGNQGRKEKKLGTEKANKTAAWLTSQGLGDQEASYLAGDPDALRAWYKEFKSGNEPKWQITELFNEQGQKIKAMVDMKTGKYNQIGGAESASSGGTEYGLTPQYGIDENGNPALIQLGKDGKAIKTPLPDGVTLSKEPIRMDAGTHFVLMDPVTRQVIGTVPKENRAAASETAIGTAQGKAQGEASVDLGNALTKADQSITLIDQMIEHPGRETATGKSSTWDPRNYMAGTDATDFNVMAKQLEGKAFLEAFESLKGGGQITEVEGQRATEAIARLNKAQSDEAYKAALLELRGILEKGKQRSVQRAGGAPAPVAPPPSGGVPLDDLLKKYGG